VDSSTVAVDTHAAFAESAPNSASTLPEVLQWHVSTHPERAHIQHYDDHEQGDVITYRALWDAAREVAGGLQRRGIQPGDTVALMLPTGSGYFFSFFGILLAGAIPVPIYPPVRRTQIEDHLRRQSTILKNCQAKMLITVPEAKLVAQLLTAQVETLKHVVTVEELRGHGDGDVVAVRASDIGFIQYTSGSTGDPKGVVLTHANLLANIRADGEGLQAESSDVFVSWLPLYHDMGLIGAWLGTLYHSVRLVIMSPLMFLSRPQRWLWAIHRYGGTLSAAPNFAYELCLKRIADEDLEGLDLSTWRLAANGAETISPRTLEEFCQRFAKYGFRREAMFPVYGLAECAVGLTFPPLHREPLVDVVQRDVLTREGRAQPAPEDDANALRLVACGRPLPGHEIRVVDAGGHELPERSEGRLQFRGPSATSGYYRNPHHTQRLFQGDWLETGDLAYIAGGDLYLTGRSKDLIIRAGRNIYPTELEEAIGELQGIRTGRVAVFGSTDPARGTERLIVLAETRASMTEARDALRDQINAVATRLVDAPPDDIVLAPPNTVLKTSSGKIRRAASRELYENDRIGKPARAVWWQVTRLLLAGAVPRMRATLRRIGDYLFGAYAWAVTALCTPFAWLAAVLPPRMAWRWSALRGVLRMLTWCTGTQFRVQGAENIASQAGACVVVANHQSYLDAFILTLALRRELIFLAKAELQRFGFVALALRRLGTHFVQRYDTRQGIEDARRATQALQQGKTLAIFAEGTFKRMPGLLPFHMGAFVTAVEAGVPIVPVAISGSRSALHAESWLPRHASLAVTVGTAIAPDSDGDTWTAALTLRDAVRVEILRLCGEPDLQHESNRIEP
jgi:1-acyl-sn-glycerol-3-phosphate acyltransferase